MCWMIFSKFKMIAKKKKKKMEALKVNSSIYSHMKQWHVYSVQPNLYRMQYWVRQKALKRGGAFSWEMQF